ncbi:unnamed protein product [Spodoptera littoralis]|uniref:Spaetzle domain-containing protein n=1 Tax=Spodoptera littoralis TaxID=7109 RepID=A0A9P0I0L2_SPOLI|nr:unnamed protein product [Spodoptera littoralis]CAH1637306.1 unnamed protein product [Spodoptera littoralis]
MLYSDCLVLRGITTANHIFRCMLSSLQLANGASTTKDGDSSIVFPGPTQDIKNRYGNVVPEKCKDMNFCTVKPNDYPQDLFNKIFKGKFKEPIFQPTFMMTDDRQGDPDEVDDCDTVVTFEPLYKVKSLEGEWRTVVQAPEENYLQMVRIESCKSVGSACFTSFRDPTGLKPFCKQKYSVWEFLVHDGKNGTEKIKVNLPTCCACQYKRSLA